MYRALDVQNFRCFGEFKFENLRRVNLIAGRNGVGKTTLLEALFLHLGRHNPSLWLSLHAFRGIPTVEAKPLSMWGWMFRNRDVHKEICLTGHMTDSRRPSLTMSLVPPETAILSTENSVGAGSSDSERSFESTELEATELLIEWDDAKGQGHETRVRTTPDGKLRIDGLERVDLPTGVFSSARSRKSRDDAHRFSDVVKARSEEALVEALRVLEPRLQRLELLATTGDEYAVHGDIGLVQPVPLQYLGEGITQLLSTLVGMLAATNGAMLIDEVENGIHHEVLLDVWKVINEASKRSNVQLFLTTHSWENIIAAHSVFRDSTNYDFALHRLDRVDGEIKAKSYDQETLQAAIDGNIEIR